MNSDAHGSPLAQVSPPPAPTPANVDYDELRRRFFARTSWRDAMAGHTLAPRRAPRAAEAEPRFSVVVLGFRVNHRSNDHLIGTDGAGDEISVFHSVTLADSTGTAQIQAQDRTKVMGRAKNDPTRVQAGSASRFGGLTTGDAFPDASPEQIRRQLNASPDRVPVLLFNGQLPPGDAGMAVIVSLVEEDRATNFLQEFTKALLDSGPALLQLAGAFTGNPALVAGADAAASALPVISTQASKLFRPVGSHPIGMVKQGDEFVFSPTVLVLNNELATRIAETNLGHGNGIIPLTFQDDSHLSRANYTVFVSVTRIVPVEGGEIG